MYLWMLFLALTGIIQGQSVISGPKSATEIIGRSANFGCEVDFTGSIEAIQWLFNGQIIYAFEKGKEDFPWGHVKYSVTQDGKNFGLTVKNLEFGDGGKYDCMLITDSATALLIVLDTPELLTPTPDQLEGTTAQFICKAKFSGPSKEDDFPHLLTSFHGDPLNGTVQRKEYNGFTNYYQYTQIHNITLEASMNKKILMCEIGTSDPVKHVNIKVEVRVLYWVRNIDYKPNRARYEIGMVINCTADGSPEPDFVWEDMKNHEKIVVGKLLQITQEMLGTNTWRCTASNNITGQPYKENVVAVFEVDYAKNAAMVGVGVGVTICLVAASLLAVLSYRFYRKLKLEHNGGKKVIQDLQSSSPMLPEGEKETTETDKMDAVEQISKALYKSKDWFHGILPKKEVEHLLEKNGDFLVTVQMNSDTNQAQYELSFMWNNDINHVVINYDKESWSMSENENQFTSIMVLISNLLGRTRDAPFLRELTAIKRQGWELNTHDVVRDNEQINENCAEIALANFKGKPVAVKVCKKMATVEDKKRFLHECRFLMKYEHKNIASFFGLTVSEQPLILVMEPGCRVLLTFLQKHSNDQDEGQLTQMCEDVAAGMIYLEEKCCIHRNLAARNCLIADNNKVKIANFFMAKEGKEYQCDIFKQVYQTRTAPEADKTGIYTTQSDVWSFGVLMWEIFSYGKTPCTKISRGRLFQTSKEDYIVLLEAPDGTPGTIYDLMLKCWKTKPEDRITFKTLKTNLHFAYSVLSENDAGGTNIEIRIGGHGNECDVVSHA